MKRLFKRNISIALLGLILILGNSSCVNLKKTLLLKETTITDYFSEIVNSKNNDYQINNGDHLYIKVFSTDPQTSRYFQTDFPEVMNNSYIYINSYKVDNEDYVSYSFTGKTKVKGLTIEEAQEAIKQNLNEFFKDVNVYVKLVNFNISILGEVDRPGTYTIDSDQITILQALGLAGGITEFSRANKVVLIRKSANGNIVKHLDLTDNGILQSEYFYLLPDDVVYIAPRNSKSFTFSQFPYQIILGILSMTFSIVALTTK